VRVRTPDLQRKRKGRWQHESPTRAPEDHRFDQAKTAFNDGTSELILATLKNVRKETAPRRS